MAKRFLRLLSLLSILIVPGFSGTFNITTDSDFLSGNLTNCDNVGTGTNGTLQLKTTTASYSGCTLKVDSNSNFAMTNSLRQVSIRFTAQTTQTIDKVMLLVYVYSGSIATYQCDFRSDDGTSDHNPGAVLGTGIVDCATLSTGTQWVTIDVTDSAVTAGQYYHISVRDTGVSSTATDYMAVCYTTPKTGITSNTNGQDSLLSFLQTIDGGTWTDSNGQPIYILLPTGSGINEGNVYYTSATNLSVYGANFHGERINITGASRVVRKAGFYVKANTSTPPAEHLYAVLYCITDGIELENIKLADKNDITPDYEWYSADFSRPRILETGKSYRVYIKSPLSTSVNYYQAYKVEAFTPSLTVADALTYDGANSLYAAYTSGTWVENVEKSDLLFRLTTATYEAGGNYVSSLLDAGATAAFNTLSWVPVTQPANTLVKYQIASALTELGPWNYYGPDGTASTYYTVSGQTISPVHSGKRFILLKALLESTSNDTTPVVNSVAIDYSSRVLPGTGLQTVCSPVPFTPGAGAKLSINYILTKDSKVTLRVYSLSGALVKEVICASGADGGRGDTSGYNNKIEWDGNNGLGMVTASGVYVVRLVVEPGDGTEKTIETKKIMVIR
ncbi:MAG: hypothetical protein A2231_05685 [Candidatus Firestonebacteria bacterium RIFOXYA2_FULL_40_8]|nr:MAG: hypothetical protein A2231_05685 [Candidatus Firestonebacteria bacterium RIFOXYA2_FULL_40_8]